jgi:hypothetical protein
MLVLAYSARAPLQSSVPAASIELRLLAAPPTADTQTVPSSEVSGTVVTGLEPEGRPSRQSTHNSSDVQQSSASTHSAVSQHNNSNTSSTSSSPSVASANAATSDTSHQSNWNRFESSGFDKTAQPPPLFEELIDGLFAFSIVESGQALTRTASISSLDTSVSSGTTSTTPIASDDIRLLVELYVDTRGKVVDAVLLEQSEKVNWRKAQAVIMQWVFSPAQRNNQPVASRKKLELVFQPRTPSSTAEVPQTIPSMMPPTASHPTGSATSPR